MRKSNSPLYKKQGESIEESSNRDAASTVLARSFIDDPAVAWALPRTDTREAHLRWLFRRNLIANARCSGWFETDRPENPRGVAVWISGESPYIPLSAELAAGLWASPAVLGLRASTCFLRLQDHWARWRRASVPTSHFYLFLLGVVPEARGQGLSRQLLAPGLEKADRVGWPVALETHLATNVALYRRFGFELISETRIDQDGPTCFAMVRPPNINGSS